MNLIKLTSFQKNSSKHRTDVQQVMGSFPFGGQISSNYYVQSIRNIASSSALSFCISLSGTGTLLSSTMLNVGLVQMKK